MKPTCYEITLTGRNPVRACDALAEHTGLSKSSIKQAMTKGAVWRKRAKAGRHRLRRATAMVRPGEQLKFYYDPAILMLKPLNGQCLKDLTQYSVWLKPAGMLTQGSHFGDHCSLLRQVELHFKKKRKVFLIHRLDREAAGIVILAHTRKVAAYFSTLFQNHAVEKRYRVWVYGNLLGNDPKANEIHIPLDGKEAATHFTPLRYDTAGHQTLLDVSMRTGRYHQIRRHFYMIDHPVMGDWRYGRLSNTSQKLKLVAYFLKVKCPLAAKGVQLEIDPQKWGMV